MLLCNVKPTIRGMEPLTHPLVGGDLLQEDVQTGTYAVTG
jgi:hypothetical protein